MGGYIRSQRPKRQYRVSPVLGTADAVAEITLPSMEKERRACGLQKASAFAYGRTVTKSGVWGSLRYNSKQFWGSSRIHPKYKI